jgi:hypothetical protein
VRVGLCRWRYWNRPPRAEARGRYPACPAGGRPAPGGDAPWPPPGGPAEQGGRGAAPRSVTIRPTGRATEVPPRTAVQLAHGTGGHSARSVTGRPTEPSCPRRRSPARQGRSAPAVRQSRCLPQSRQTLSPRLPTRPELPPAALACGTGRAPLVPGGWPAHGAGRRSSTRSVTGRPTGTNRHRWRSPARQGHSAPAVRQTGCFPHATPPSSHPRVTSHSPRSTPRPPASRGASRWLTGRHAGSAGPCRALVQFLWRPQSFADAQE